MSNDFESESTDSGWKLYLFCIWTGLLIYFAHGWGYSEARAEYTVTTKYRCNEGVVYRLESNYWFNTKQPCKSLEELK